MFFNTLAIASFAAILSTIVAAPLPSDGGINKRFPAPQVTSTAPAGAPTKFPIHIDNTWPRILPIHIDEVDYKAPGNIIKRQVDEDYGPIDEDYVPIDDDWPKPLDLIDYILDEEYPPPPVDEEWNRVKRQVDEDYVPIDADYGPVDDDWPKPLDLIDYRIDEEYPPPPVDEEWKRTKRQVDEGHPSAHDGTGPLPW